MLCVLPTQLLTVLQAGALAGFRCTGCIFYGLPFQHCSLLPPKDFSAILSPVLQGLFLSYLLQQSQLADCRFPKRTHQGSSWGCTNHRGTQCPPRNSYCTYCYHLSFYLGSSQKSTTQTVHYILPVECPNRIKAVGCSRYLSTYCSPALQASSDTPLHAWSAPISSTSTSASYMFACCTSCKSIGSTPSGKRSLIKPTSETISSSMGSALPKKSTDHRPFWPTMHLYYGSLCRR